MVNRSGNALLVLAVITLFVPAYGKPAKNERLPDIVIDLSPLRKAPGVLDAKITISSRTVKGDTFKRGINIKGRVTEHTAEDTLSGMKMLYEFHGWEAQELPGGMLRVVGKDGSPAAKVEILVEGLAKGFRPIIVSPKEEKAK